MPADNHCLRPNAAPSQLSVEKNSARRRSRHGLLLACWLGAVGLSACHSGRAPVAGSNEPAALAAKAPSAQIVVMRGQVFSIKDSTTVIPGMELGFKNLNPDSLGGGYRILTGPNGEFQMQLGIGQAYLITLSRNGKKWEELRYAVPAQLGDSSALVNNFYSTFIDDDSDDFGWRNIYFDTNRSALRPQSTVVADAYIQYFQQVYSVGAIVLVAGHSEPSEVPRGHPMRERYLEGIGWERARATCAYLVKKGFPASKLFMVSYGDQRPAAPNDSPEERQLNRRVELQVTGLEYVLLQSGRRAIPYLKTSPPAKRSVSSKLVPRMRSAEKLPAKHR